MKAYLVIAAFGAACLPATYHASREGTFVVTVALIVGISFVGGALGMLVAARSMKQFTLLKAVGAFGVGALLSEAAALLNYFNASGFHDWSLSLFISVLEFAVIATLGSVVTLTGIHVVRRLKPSGTASHA
jgi:hypothetical protein